MTAHTEPILAIPREQITGVVLAGGLSRRMDAHGTGTDKGLLLLGHQPMVRQVIDRLAPQVGPLLLNANRNLPARQAFGLPVIADRIEGFAGPLAGLHAVMSCSTTPWIVTVPCDSPFLPTDLVKRLAHAVISADAQVAMARTGDQTHPVFALVRAHLLTDLEAFLASGRRRIDAWTGRLHTIEVPFADEEAFVNINTPQELQQHATRPSP